MRAPAPRLVPRVTSRLSPRLAPTSRRFAAAPRRLRAAGAACLAACLVLATSLAEAAPPLVERLKLPPGFHAEVFAADVANAREMVWSPRGILYVGSTEGSVHALTVRDGRVVARHVVASGLEMPVGVAWRDGALYISAISRILRLDGVDERLDQPPKPVVVTDKLPSERQHGWKFIAFGPDGKLYVPVGAPCNICEPDRDRYAMIGRMNADGSDYQRFARGVRNTVGFDWHPVTHELWFTDNGRDMLGDDVPDDELNRAPRAGLDFGYPYCHAGDVADPQYGKGHPCSGFTPPALKLGAHVAALGMRFYTGSMFPADYRNAIFIAEHGSWNRSSKSGYRVVRVSTGPDGGKPRMEVFAQGWLQPGEQVWGRPADVLPLPDGSLLISDDYANAIYRITYTGH
ncbi:PQQ-dependent sugar dehydrogenase [Burkholderia gladioli]|uniref:PQQ-dependent sugar dehydrogenase n=1 Tax=Burkholderia gladioli TaxID=28095 RepID=UPI00184F3479|nr:sorbosone dehydrogenase family protein [Burkholderia gladioli]MBA1362044.1 sorbosone dehydrogenase family protein [Burkholderia gladioli]